MLRPKSWLTVSHTCCVVNNFPNADLEQSVTNVIIVFSSDVEVEYAGLRIWAYYNLTLMDQIQGILFARERWVVMHGRKVHFTPKTWSVSLEQSRNSGRLGYPKSQFGRVFLFGFLVNILILVINAWSPWTITINLWLFRLIVRASDHRNLYNNRSKCSLWCAQLGRQNTFA